jgi:hypothetical protein
MVMTCDRVRELASGFVLGALDTDDMIAVGDHLESCRKPHPEVNELGGVLPYIAESLEPVEPPAWLRESVIAAARADLVARCRVGKPSEHRTAEPVAVAAMPDERRRTQPLAPVISIAAARVSRRRRALTWTMRAAAAVAIVALSGYSINLQSQLSAARANQDAQASMLAALGDPGTRHAVLVPVDGSLAGGVAALRPTGHILFNAYGLAATTGTHEYVVWLSSGDGSPTGSWTKEGSFTVDSSGTGRLEVDNVPTTANLWIYVCLEANDNVKQPTGPRVLSGTIWL